MVIYAMTLICFINSVPGLLCSLEQLKVRLSVTPNSWQNIMSASPALFFESMGYMRDKNALFTKTCAYLLPSSDLNLASIVSVYQSPWKVFLVNNRSVLYLLLNGRTALIRNFCVFFFNVLAAVEIQIPQRSLISWAVTSKCLSELWSMRVIGTSDFPGSMLGLPNSILFSKDIFLFLLVLVV